MSGWPVVVVTTLVLVLFWAAMVAFLTGVI